MSQSAKSSIFPKDGIILHILHNKCINGAQKIVMAY